MVFYFRCISFRSVNQDEIQANRSVDTFQTAQSTFEPRQSGSAIPRAQNVSSLNASPNLRVFSFSELEVATNNFHQSKVIGEGGFATVYLGTIKSKKHPYKDIQVAVKRGNKRGQKGYKPWVTEVNFLGEIDHPNLVKLIGYCNEESGDESQLLLVYEYMPKKSLDIHLSANSNESLPWITRLKIAQHAATGLAYLHEGMGPGREIIFRDFKPSNILLDNNMNAKLSDFGFARLGPQDGRTHVSSLVVGTKGYAAPEYVQTGRLTNKIDVWSYGIFLEELITGQRPLGQKASENNPQLFKWICCSAGAGPSKLVPDRRLEGRYSEKSMQKVEFIAKKCLVKDAKMRPRMSEVLQMVNDAITLENQQLPNGGHTWV